MSDHSQGVIGSLFSIYFLYIAFNTSTNQLDEKPLNAPPTTLPCLPHPPPQGFSTIPEVPEGGAKNVSVFKSVWF